MEKDNSRMSCSTPVCSWKNEWIVRPCFTSDSKGVVKKKLWTLCPVIDSVHFSSNLWSSAHFCFFLHFPTWSQNSSFSLCFFSSIMPVTCKVMSWWKWLLSKREWLVNRESHLPTVNPNTLWSQFQANISRMVGRINTRTSALSS